jgi:hypothetical protein
VDIQLIEVSAGIKIKFTTQEFSFDPKGLSCYALGNEDTRYIKLTTPAYKTYETRKPRIA